MNVVLQLLAFLGVTASKPGNTEFTAVWILLGSVASGKEPTASELVLAAREVCNTVQNFVFGAKNDAHEFLLRLADTCELSDRLRLVVKNSRQCTACGDRFGREEQELGLTLPLPAHSNTQITISALLNTYFEEQLQGYTLFR
jgi:hypothetical protein